MNMSGESLLIILFVGLVAGWLAGQIVQGTRFGFLGDLVLTLSLGGDLSSTTAALRFAPRLLLRCHCTPLEV